MKKIIYILLLAACSSFAITSCTEEPVKPVYTDNGGGNGSSDPLKR